MYGLPPGSLLLLVIQSQNLFRYRCQLPQFVQLDTRVILNPSLCLLTQLGNVLPQDFYGGLSTPANERINQEAS